MNVKFKASARTTALHRTGAGRQRNPTAPVGGEVFSLDIPFHRTDETNSPARAASDPYCESQATMPSSSVGSRWSHPEKAGNPEPEAGNQLRRLAQDDVSL